MHWGIELYPELPSRLGHYRFRDRSFLIQVSSIHLTLFIHTRSVRLQMFIICRFIDSSYHHLSFVSNRQFFIFLMRRLHHCILHIADRILYLTGGYKDSNYFGVMRLRISLEMLPSPVVSVLKYLNFSTSNYFPSRSTSKRCRFSGTSF